MRDAILSLGLAVLGCVLAHRLMGTTETHHGPARTEVAREAPIAPGEGASASDRPFDCVATAVAGSVEVEISTPGCFGGDERDGVHFDWKRERASMRSMFADGHAAAALLRTALVDLLRGVSDHALS